MYEWKNAEVKEEEVKDEEKKEDSPKEDLEVSPALEPQPERRKKKSANKPKPKLEPLVALKTCDIDLDDCTVALVKGQEVHGLKREEREHLKFHGFIG